MLAVSGPQSTLFSARGEDSSSYQAAKDTAQFNGLLSPPIEFLEGSSTGGTLLGHTKYEPINASPKTQRTELPKTSPAAPASPNAVASSSKNLYTGAIDLGWPNLKSHASGLQNLGNTCFLNSVLQCLIHTPPLVNILVAHTKDICRVKQGFCMACNMRSTTLKAFTAGRAFPPADITGRLNTIAKGLRKGRQEDSHEFLRYAIDALQKSCLHGLNPKLDHKIQETTWVHKIFGGRLRSRVTCTQCGYNSDTFDSILDLSIDINGQNSINTALRKFVAPDYLKGADKYKCDKCKKPVNAEKRFSVHDSPAVLTLHLKRFSPMGKKIGHMVQYDERLSLAPAMSEGQFGPTYTLAGVICHSGGGPHSGHYYSYVKRKDSSWAEMNDEIVAPQGNRVPLQMKSAYILFYVMEKGQQLKALTESASSTSPFFSSKRPTTPLSTNGKKRKASTGEDDDDVGVKTTKPFIGPMRPLSALEELDAKRGNNSKVDPQAASIIRKIAAASGKKNATATTSALTSLADYGSDDEREDGEAPESQPINRTADGAIVIHTPTDKTLPPVNTDTFYNGNGSSSQHKKKHGHRNAHIGGHTGGHGQHGGGSGRGKQRHNGSNPWGGGFSAGGRSNNLHTNNRGGGGVKNRMRARGPSRAV